MSFRKRLEDSKSVEWLLGLFLSSYLRFCMRTTKWSNDGLDDLRAALKDGPVVLVLWHSRILYGPAHWPRETAPLSTLRDPSPAGRLSAATQSRFGMEPFAMHDKKSNRAASREILRRFADGISLGLTGDGPIGPALEMKTPPVEWARATGRPVFFYAFSVRRHRRLSAWDNMMIPLPFTTGKFIYRQWEQTVPRRASAEEMDALRQEMQDALSKTQADADLAIGLEPGR